MQAQSVRCLVEDLLHVARSLAPGKRSKLPSTPRALETRIYGGGAHGLGDCVAAFDAYTIFTTTQTISVRTLCVVHGVRAALGALSSCATHSLGAVSTQLAGRT